MIVIASHHGPPYIGNRSHSHGSRRSRRTKPAMGMAGSPKAAAYATLTPPAQRAAGVLRDADPTTPLAGRPAARVTGLPIIAHLFP